MRPAEFIFDSKGAPIHQGKLVRYEVVLNECPEDVLIREAVSDESAVANVAEAIFRLCHFQDHLLPNLQHINEKVHSGLAVCIIVENKELEDSCCDLERQTALLPSEAEIREDEDVEALHAGVKDIHLLEFLS